MTPDTDVVAVEIARASEQLRQERETFEQQRVQDARWFVLKLIMGYASITGLLGILGISSYVILNASRFSMSVVTAAGSALFVDALGLFVSVWKGVVSAGSSNRLTPVTRSKLQTSKSLPRDTA